MKSHRLAHVAIESIRVDAADGLAEELVSLTGMVDPLAGDETGPRGATQARKRDQSIRSRSSVVSSDRSSQRSPVRRCMVCTSCNGSPSIWPGVDRL